jgi:hypothetical protein
MSDKARLPAACTPLAQLNQYIRAARAAADERAAPPGEALEPNELVSARRFRQAWETYRTHDEVEQAVARKPVNAGPLNSHVLVLQLLGLMQELSPQYLRRFVTQVESLQWLERASEQHPRPQSAQAKAAKAARRGRPKK